VMTGWGRLHAFIAVVALAALAVFSWAVPQVPTRDLLVGLLAVGLLEWAATTFREDVKVSLTNVVVLVLLVVSGPALAIASTMAVAPVIARRAPAQRVLRTVFNGAQIGLCAAGASGAYVATVTALGASFPDAGSLLALAVASVVYSVVNHALVAVPVAITSSETFFGAFRTVVPSLALQVPNVGLTALAAVLLIYVSPWALGLMLVPAAVARYALLSYQRVDEAYDRLVRGFVKAIEVKDLYTRGHSERVSMLSVEVARELGVSYDERRLTRYAALLHDVGKIGVPLCVINKPGPLDDDEFEHIKQHPTIGAEILRDIDFLAPAIDIVRYHHERLDGRGYPHGIGGDDLSRIVRIVTAVDAFDAMTSTRSYRRAFGVDEAIAELRRCADRQFDADVVEALARRVAQIGWEPTTEFASSTELHGEEIPEGVLEERSQPEVSG
jgi:putative nucleotidyltransferase with HDIG domain